MNKKESYPQKANSTSFKKGMPSPNPAGRPKGSKNVINKYVRNTLEHALGINIATANTDLKAMSPYQRMMVEINIMKFLYKEKRTAKRGDSVINIEVTYSPKPIATEDANAIEIQSHDQIKND